MKQTWTTGDGSNRAGMIAGLGAVAALGLVAVVAAARILEERIGVRNTVYSVTAAALLFVVVVDAVHHRLARADLAQQDPAWAPEAATTVSGGEDPVVQELRLAARLGAELMGDAPASRMTDRPVSPAA